MDNYHLSSSSPWEAYTLASSQWEFSVFVPYHLGYLQVTLDISILYLNNSYDPVTLCKPTLVLIYLSTDLIYLVRCYYFSMYPRDICMFSDNDYILRCLTHSCICVPNVTPKLHQLLVKLIIISEIVKIQSVR